MIVSVSRNKSVQDSIIDGTRQPFNKLREWITPASSRPF
jgi:hypothetical protein